MSELLTVSSPLRSAGQPGSSQTPIEIEKSSTPASVTELFPMSLAMKRTRTVPVSATKSAAKGVKALQVGAASSPLAVFDRIDYVQVAPDYAVGRIGGNGGSTPVVQGRFEAVAYSVGRDGKKGTKDDWAIGPVPARTTSTLKLRGTAAQARPAPTSTARITPIHNLVSEPFATGWIGTRVISVMVVSCSSRMRDGKRARNETAP